jgi:hypothetical protein
MYEILETNHKKSCPSRGSPDVGNNPKRGLWIVVKGPYNSVDYTTVG